MFGGGYGLVRLAYRLSNKITVRGNATLRSSSRLRRKVVSQRTPEFAIPGEHFEKLFMPFPTELSVAQPQGAI